MKVPRNDPCPCGSGKKYKRCHLKTGTAVPGHASEPHFSPFLSPDFLDEALDITEDSVASRDHQADPAQQMLAFMQPLLKRVAGDAEQLSKLAPTGAFLWDLALLPDDERNARIEDIAAELASTREQHETIRAALGTMIIRHQRMFPWLHEGKPE